MRAALVRRLLYFHISAGSKERCSAAQSFSTTSMQASGKYLGRAAVLDACEEILAVGLAKKVAVESIGSISQPAARDAGDDNRRLMPIANASVL